MCLAGDAVSQKDFSSLLALQLSVRNLFKRIGDHSIHKHYLWFLLGTCLMAANSFRDFILLCSQDYLGVQPMKYKKFLHPSSLTNFISP